jgi:hypothetical protein
MDRYFARCIGRINPWLKEIKLHNLFLEQTATAAAQNRVPLIQIISSIFIPGIKLEMPDTYR